MSRGAVTTLAEVLADISGLSWDHALYIPIAAPGWSADVPVIVLDPESSENPGADPIEATDNGLRYALTVASITDALENLRAQDGTADLARQIKALRYYFENDAFIDLK